MKSHGIAQRTDIHGNTPINAFSLHVNGFIYTFFSLASSSKLRCTKNATEKRNRLETPAFPSRWRHQATVQSDPILKPGCRASSNTSKFEFLAPVRKEVHFRENYRGFHITFDKRVPKFVRNFRNSLRTWQFHYVLVNQIVNLEMKLWFIGKLTSSLREKFAPFGEIVSEFP